jgi:hypothetical protein
LAPVIKSVLVVMFIMLSFLRSSGVVVIDDVAGEAIEHSERRDLREVSDHRGTGSHRFHRRQVAPLRVDDHMALIRGGDEAGRNPAIEFTDDLLCTVTQELDEP